MQYNYKTQSLIAEGVDFRKVYSDKQEVVKEMTMFDFNLSNIVSFMKKETDNFSKKIELALDLDRHINAIYLKWLSSEKPTPRAVASENEAIIRFKKEIDDVNMLIELESDKKEIEKLKGWILELNQLIELES